MWTTKKGVKRCSTFSSFIWRSWRFAHKLFEKTRVCFFCTWIFKVKVRVLSQDLHCKISFLKYKIIKRLSFYHWFLWAIWIEKLITLSLKSLSFFQIIDSFAVLLIDVSNQLVVLLSGIIICMINKFYVFYLKSLLCNSRNLFYNTLNFCKTIAS